MELYKKYRPTKFREVIGQRDAVSALAAMGKKGEIPHCILLTGPSGTGKTTIARILKTAMGCSDVDFVEVNGSEQRGIDSIREIKSRMQLAPLGGRCRIWLVDECHALTADAQNSFLKILEDTPPHVYFMLATTDPGKLKKTIHTRSTEIRCKEIASADLLELVKGVCEKEAVNLPLAVVEAVVDAAEGSARKALVVLNVVLGLDNEEQMLASIESNDTRGQAISIARALMDSQTGWEKMRKVLSEVDEPAESLRRLVLSYCRSVLLRSANKRAAMIMEEFRDNFYDSDKAGLALACWNVVVK